MKIAVLFGGDSAERDVSAASAAQVVGALRSKGHDVIAVDTQRGALPPAEEKALLTGRIDKLPPARADAAGLPALVARLDLREVDLVFIALHGGAGEDGTVQAVLDLAGMAYTGSGRLGSALGMAKDVSKRLFVQAGIPTPDWLMAPVDASTVAERLGFPVIVKPNAEGSTVGLTLVEDAGALDAAVAAAARFDGEVIVERYIAGRELTVGVLDDAPLAVGEIIPARGSIFDYAAKYQTGGAEEIFPADLTAARTRRVQELGLAAHRALKLDCYSRADFRMDADGNVWCLEVNTLPGLTAGSLLPRSAAAVGISFPELCQRIVEGALRKRRARGAGSAPRE
ncbi:MAG TPA: D-alanine--D-alanine ligase [Gammaproteobacteria bacterium]|nr:D-alanine--D-alanine ligase [Gammaproteobacteria bacterium]